MKKIAIMLLSFLLLFVGPVTAKNIQMEGQINQKVNYLKENEIIEGITELNLEFKKEFAFDKKLYLNPVFKLSYDENTDFSTLKLNEKNEEDRKYDILKEAYFDLYLKKADLRVGKQMVSWGSAFKMNPTDVVNPIDFTADDPTEAELAVPAVKTDYYFDFKNSLSGVVIGQHRPSPIPDAVESMVEETASGMIEENLIENITYTLINDYGLDPAIAEQEAKKKKSSIMENNFSVNEPKAKEMKDISDAEAALKFTRRNIMGYDFSLSYFRGYGDMPLIINDYDKMMQELGTVVGQYLSGSQPSKEIPLEFGYKETQSIGLSSRGSIRDIGLWSEFNYSQNEDNEKKMDLVLGSDYTFENDFYTIVQLFHRSYKDYKINKILESEGYDKLLKDEKYLILHGELPFRSIHTIKTDIIKNLKGEGYMFNPAVELSLANDYNLNLGAVVLSDQNDKNSFSTLSMLGEEKAYIEFSWTF